jgi:hypothetical protein
MLLQGVNLVDIRSFINYIFLGEGTEDILHCSKWEDLNVSRLYRIIVLNHLIENIPVFKMNDMWKKLKNTLAKAGVIIIKTAIYVNPNELNSDEQDFQKIRCNKQIAGTLLRECLKQNLILAHSEEDCYAFIRKEELSTFNEEKQAEFTNHHHTWLSKFGLSVKEQYTEDDYRKLVPGAGRLMIGCVAENNKKYQTQALRLVQSIRWFGDKTAGANIFVCIVDDADPEFVAELKKWGVFVRIVKRFSVTHPPSNKLRLFELPEVAFYDTIMLMDCDTVMAQDPYPFIDGEHFQADMAAGATVQISLFQKIFAHYRLPLPKQRFFTSVSRQPTIWYCNAGVLIFPHSILKTFYPVWKKYTIDLSLKKHLLDNRYFFCEQASLSIAFAAFPVPFKRLPVHMNYHLTNVALYRLKNIDPVIIHYHHMNDPSGLLKNVSQNPFVMRRVNLFNNRLKKELQLFKKSAAE